MPGSVAEWHLVQTTGAQERKLTKAIRDTEKQIRSPISSLPRSSSPRILVSVPEAGIPVFGAVSGRELPAAAGKEE